MITENNSNLPKVVVVGAGFGGLWAARTLARALVEILILERNNYHTFLPLIYQVAAAELEPEEILNASAVLGERLNKVILEVSPIQHAAVK